MYVKKRGKMRLNNFYKCRKFLLDTTLRTVIFLIELTLIGFMKNEFW